ncbi:hypothetical protein BIW12_12390 [Flavobacterium commune]|uniref:DUF4412 domain-containing protein n=2 Tax=Flavobacterium commune TaxID=1306519 RepID=A0A1D9PC79_9FLAO|nr:hypothetical protein BIW12_12390 [Flavobacterium commune]
MTVLTATVSGQNFQGQIVYQNTYTSKLPNVTSEQFSTMMGSTQNYIIKDGDYKSSTNGTMFQWQLYINKDNKLYNKMSNSETVFWNDGATNPDGILKIEVNKGVTEVLGHKCDEIVLTCKSGIQKYYFNSKISVEPSIFTGHLFGNWYDYLKVAKALPLKMVIENAQFTMTSIATEIKEMKLDDKEFQLSKNTKTVKSPY